MWTHFLFCSRQGKICEETDGNKQTQEINQNKIGFIKEKAIIAKIQKS
jgi:hypothetical protein